MSPGSPVNPNTYFASLYEHVSRCDVDVSEFNRKSAVTDRPDVIHIHFPEFLVRFGSGVIVAVVDVLKVLVILRLARLRGSRLVWTAHNLWPHDRRHRRLEDLYLNGFVRLVDRIIFLSKASVSPVTREYPALASVPFDVIPHGHYRSDFEEVGDPGAAREAIGLDRRSRVLLFFGQVRAYKNVPELIRAFAARAGDDELLVAGKVRDDADLEAEIGRLAREDRRVHTELERISDERTALLHAGSDVVVLPYAEGSSLNSGAALLALSLDRPVVVRRTPVMVELQETVGRDWVRTFEGDVSEAVDIALSMPLPDRSRQTDLRAFDWDLIGRETRACYEQALRGS